MSDDKNLHKVLSFWIEIFEKTESELTDKQREVFLNTKEAKKLASFSDEIITQSMEYAYSINTSKLKDIVDIAINEKFRPLIAESIKVDADKIDLQNKEKNKEKKQDIYSSALKELFNETLSEEKAKELLVSIDMDGWARFWKDGDIVKTKCGGGPCGIDSDGNLKRIFKYGYLAKRLKKVNQYLYLCDLNTGIHISTFKDDYGKMSEEDFYKPITSAIPIKSEDFLIQDISKVKQNECGEIALSKEGYPIFKTNVLWTFVEAGFENLDNFDVVTENAVRKINLGTNDPEIHEIEYKKKKKINLGTNDLEIDEILESIKIAVLSITGEFVIKKNGEPLCSYPKVDKEGYISLDEDENILFTEFR